MPKGDANRARTAIDTQRTQQTNQQQQIRNEFVPRYQEDRAADVGTRQQIEDRYASFDPKYDLGTILASAGGGGGGGASGGIDPSHISSFGTDPYAGYKKMSEGLRPEFWTDFNKYMGNLDEASAGYKDFSKTGGFSEQDLGNIRGRSMAPTRGIYQNMQNDLARQKSLGNVTNQSNNFRAAREANSAISDTAVNTEAGIAQNVQQGKLAGLGGMERTAMTGAQARTQVESLDQQMRAAGLGGMTDIEKTRLMAELQNAQINSSAGAANASLANQRAGMQLQADITANNQRLSNQAGWTQLYGTAPGASGQSADDLLALQNMSQGGNMNLIGQQIQASQIPGDFSQAMGNIGSVVGLAGQVGGMIAGMPSGLTGGYNPGGGLGGYGGYGYQTNQPGRGYGYGSENQYDQAGY